MQTARGASSHRSTDRGQGDRGGGGNGNGGGGDRGSRGGGEGSAEDDGVEKFRAKRQPEDSSAAGSGTGDDDGGGGRAFESPMVHRCKKAGGVRTHGDGDDDYNFAGTDAGRGGLEASSSSSSSAAAAALHGGSPAPPNDQGKRGRGRLHVGGEDGTRGPSDNVRTLLGRGSGGDSDDDGGGSSLFPRLVQPRRISGDEGGDGGGGGSGGGVPAGGLVKAHSMANHRGALRPHTSANPSAQTRGVGGGGQEGGSVLSSADIFDRRAEERLRAVEQQNAASSGCGGGGGVLRTPGSSAGGSSSLAGETAAQRRAAAAEAKLDGLLRAPVALLSPDANTPLFDAARPSLATNQRAAVCGGLGGGGGLRGKGLLSHGHGDSMYDFSAALKGEAKGEAKGGATPGEAAAGKGGEAKSGEAKGAVTVASHSEAKVEKAKAEKARLERLAAGGGGYNRGNTWGPTWGADDVDSDDSDDGEFDRRSQPKGQPVMGHHHLHHQHQQRHAPPPNKAIAAFDKAMGTGAAGSTGGAGGAGLGGGGSPLAHDGPGKGPPVTLPHGGSFTLHKVRCPGGSHERGIAGALSTLQQTTNTSLSSR